MPEIAEIRLSAELIKPLVINKKVINAFTTSNGKYKDRTKLPGFEDFLKTISSCKIVDIKTKGKFLYFIFDNEWFLFNGFGMTGQWSEKEGKHPCFGFYFDDGSQIYFNDPRHFGTLKFTNNKQELTDKLNELGWDAFQDDLDIYLPRLTKVLSKSKKPIASLLLDQKLFCGIGNYLRSEILYEIKMNPWRIGKSLSKQEIIEICEAAKEIAIESYKYQGASFRTYLDPYLNKGNYSQKFKVYNRKIDPLGFKITKEKMPDNRSIFWSPLVQIN